jgi:3-hydroxyacyl-CoA dehydrogenase/enoyl-CoA hydratase/3-hydroxybutyryl-CoA epimerase/3-hydroxyacyl-CoA dehydrogenase/enoyl-CoA hydratase/3-hydroxybutyryl-CoA epimerase/enoyl-CoA isomerase
MPSDTTLSPLGPSAVNPALDNVSRLVDRCQRETGVSAAVEATPIRSVGIVGAGIMGTGIAAANLRCGLPVVISDASAKALASSLGAIVEEASDSEQPGGADRQHAAQYARLLTIASQVEELSGCDLVLEAVVETLDVKRQIFDRLESKLRPDAVLASNTSTFPISRLGERLQRPERFCGLHFCHPVRHTKLVEVVRGKRTSDQTIAAAVAYARRLGKLPVVVNDCPGFLVNRLLSAYLNEAQEMLSQGARIEEIDGAAEAFGMPIGPLKVYDQIGIDTAFYAGRSMWDAFPDRIGVLPFLPALVKTGRLGCKTGAGFYSYPNPQHRPEPDVEADKLIQRYVRQRRSFDREELTHRPLVAMLLEATRVLQEQIVRDVRDVDAGAVFGLGFPAFRGGLLFWGDSLGAARILELLRPWVSLGPRYRPTELLTRMAADGRRFYE